MSAWFENLLSNILVTTASAPTPEIQRHCSTVGELRSLGVVVPSEVLDSAEVVRIDIDRGVNNRGLASDILLELNNSAKVFIRACLPNVITAGVLRGVGIAVRADVDDRQQMDLAATHSDVAGKALLVAFHPLAETVMHDDANRRG